MAKPEGIPARPGDDLAEQIAGAIGVVGTNPFMAPEVQARVGFEAGIPPLAMACAQVIIHSATQRGEQ
jgi:hypothetical protein